MRGGCRLLIATTLLLQWATPGHSSDRLPRPPRVFRGASPWNTPYYTTFNYSTQNKEPILLEPKRSDSLNTVFAEDIKVPVDLQQLKTPGVPKSRTLLAVTTSNVWEKTHGLLVSLANLPDSFDLMFVDECSTDGTRETLARLGLAVRHVNESRGVTFHWNLAWQYFLEGGYDHLIISNNDVLVPPGAITKMVAALDSGSCHLVSPLSTVNGKGHMGIMEGLEAVYNLTIPNAMKAISAQNYVKVQQALDKMWGDEGAPVVKRSSEFNGFFFGISKGIMAAAAGPDTLFSNRLFSFRQETDLTGRMDEQGLHRCLHAGAFVFHYKASTIPQGKLHYREKYKAACDVLQEQLRRNEQQQEGQAN